jgi:hypothetical protein
MSNLQMSVEMSVYNHARTWVRRSGMSDDGRVNRALSIVKTKGALDQAIAKYDTTANSCECPDNLHSGNICKHRLAVMMTIKADEEIRKFPLGA